LLRNTVTAGFSGDERDCARQIIIDNAWIGTDLSEYRLICQTITAHLAFVKLRHAPRRGRPAIVVALALAEADALRNGRDEDDLRDLRRRIEK
jgi:hypothetical protein